MASLCEFCSLGEEQFSGPFSIVRELKLNQIRHSADVRAYEIDRNRQIVKLDCIVLRVIVPRNRLTSRLENHLCRLIRHSINDKLFDMREISTHVGARVIN